MVFFSFLLFSSLLVVGRTSSMSVRARPPYNRELRGRPPYNHELHGCPPLASTRGRCPGPADPLLHNRDNAHGRPRLASAGSKALPPFMSARGSDLLGHPLSSSHPLCRLASCSRRHVPSGTDGSTQIWVMTLPRIFKEYSHEG